MSGAVSDRPLAIVAPMREEIAGLAKRLTRRRKSSRGPWLCGRLGGHSVVLGVTGDGRQRARVRLERLCQAERPSAVLGVGLAGALSPELRLGDVTVAAGVWTPEGAVVGTPNSKWRERLVRHSDAVEGTLVSTDRVLTTAAEKQELWVSLGEPQPAAADLESATFSRVSAANDIPFAVVRAISDEAKEDLPLDFSRFAGGDGALRRSRVVRYALARPLLWVRLLGLRSRARLGAERIAWTVARALGE